MIYVIDHEDSFTYNLVHLLEGFAPTYVSNYYDLDRKKLEKSKIIVFSPGPGDPSHYPETQKIYHQYKGIKKVIGICLGFNKYCLLKKPKLLLKKKYITDISQKLKY